MKTKVYNLLGKETGEMELADQVFNVELRPEVVHGVFVAQTNNQREPWADTKGKGEVSGGGKKPWAQKGTGRARHGSIRSPIWKGGGVVFGPKTDRSFKTKINKKTRRLAIKMCLTDKVQHGALYVLENYSFAEPKTKLFVELMKNLPLKEKTFVVLTSGKEIQVMRMTKNLPRVETLRAEDVNVMNLVQKGGVIASKEAINKLVEVFNK